MLALSIRQYSPQQQCHQHDFYQLVLPLTGLLQLQMQNDHWLLHPGEIALIPTATEHRFAAQSLSRFLVLDLELLPADLLAYAGKVVMLPAVVSSYLVVLEQLLLESSPLLNQAGALLLELLTHSPLRPRLDQRLQSALVYMQKNLSQEIDLTQLAREASLSLSQFKQLFKKQLAQTPGDYLTQLRMQHGRQLLQFSDLPVQRIASLCGYQSASAFSARFRLHFQQNPQQFRQNPNLVTAE